MPESLAAQRQPALDVITPPWDYNASAWSQRIPIILLALVAALVCVYMGLYQWRLIDSVRDPVFGSKQTDRPDFG